MDQASPRALNIPKLSLLSSHMNNTMLTRSNPWKISVLDKEVFLESVFPIGDFSSVYTVVVRCGESDWFIEFSQMPPLKIHPFFADKPKELYVPESVKVALLEILIMPLLKEFEAFMGGPVELVETSLAYEQEVRSSCSVSLMLRVEDESIPIRLGIKKRNDALAFLEKLKTLPSKYRDISNLPIAIGFEAGYTKLTMSRLCELQKDDFLIPDKYFIQEEKIRLRFAGLLVDCKFNGGTATVMEVNSTEASTSEGQGAAQDLQPNEPQAAQAANQRRQAQADPSQTKDPANTASGRPSAKIDAEGLELPVVFELERRFMSVHDIGALAPGYTFALSVDLQSPVTLRVNGRAIGMGRLVELNGVLGVQIIQLMDASNA